MFSVHDLSNRYNYDFSLHTSLRKAFSTRFDKHDPYQVTAFINELVKFNEWPWDDITMYNCKRVEFLIQEKMPSYISTRKDIYTWIVSNWQQYYFPSNVSLN